MKANLPRFLFVGTAKAGTTSVYRLLREHPDISIPVKETFYFMKQSLGNLSLPYPLQRDASDLILEAEAYRKLYTNSPGKITGEIGTGYLYRHEESIPLIADMLGTDVRICIILRNPANRCFSSYMHFRKDLFDSKDFEGALAAEPERIREGRDFMWHHRAVGLYADQVSAFRKVFPHTRVWFFEDFKQAPEKILNEITAFIGAPPLSGIDLERGFNPSGEPRRAWLQKFITHENPVKSALRPAFRVLFSKEKREQIRKGAKAANLKKGIGMDPEIRRALVDYYREDVERLGTMLGRDLENWLEHSGTVTV